MHSGLLIKKESYLSLGWFEAFAHSICCVVRFHFGPFCALHLFWCRLLWFLSVTCGPMLSALFFFGSFVCRPDISGRSFPILLFSYISFSSPPLWAPLPSKLCQVEAIFRFSSSPPWFLSICSLICGFRCWFHLFAIFSVIFDSDPVGAATLPPTQFFLLGS